MDGWSGIIYNGPGTGGKPRFPPGRRFGKFPDFTPGGIVLRPFVVLAALVTAGPSVAPQTGEEVIRMMHSRYAGKWYRTVTFTQKTTLPDGKIETWYEALEVPARLRIDIAPLSGRNVILFRSDTVYRYANGEVKVARALVHPLLLLGFDVYGQPPEVTIGKLKGLGYDLSKAREGTWQGRKVWIVGAAAGDSTSKQFWVDQERLVYVRSLEPAVQKPGVTSEVQFNKYVKLGQGWIETEVLMLENGKVVVREEYRDMKPDARLPAGLFAGGAYAAPGWVTE